MKMRLLTVGLALASLYQCNAEYYSTYSDGVYACVDNVTTTAATCAPGDAACHMLKSRKECPNPRLPGFHSFLLDNCGNDMVSHLPCNMDVMKEFQKLGPGDFMWFWIYVGGLCYMFTGFNIAKNFFWKPSWNALLSFVGMGATTQELNSDHFSTFANCIGHFFIATIATFMTRSTIGLSILVGCCALEIWVISGFAVLFNPGGANLHIVGFDLLKDIIFHAASITGFFFFTGFMEPPEAVLQAAKEKQAAAAAAASGSGNANAAAGASTLGKVDIAQWFLILGLFGLWIGYTLLVFLENCCCKSCLGSGEQEDDQSKQARIEEKAGESVSGGVIPGADVENGREFPDVATPQEQSPGAVDATLANDNGGDADEQVVSGLQAELQKAQSVSLWVAPESMLGKVKWVLTWPFWIVLTFTVPTFRDDEDPGHYRDIAWTDIFKVLISFVMVNLWMIIFGVVIVHWGVILGAVLDFEYAVVGLIIFAVGLSFDNLMDAMRCGWTDSDTAYQLSEGFAAQVNNFTFTLGCILTIYMIQENEQMPVYDGMRLAMMLLACAAVALYVFLWFRGMEATPVLGCLMVEFGILICGAILYLTYEKPDLHLTWTAKRTAAPL